MARVAQGGGRSRMDGLAVDGPSPRVEEAGDSVSSLMSAAAVLCNLQGGPLTHNFSCLSLQLQGHGGPWGSLACI